MTRDVSALQSLGYAVQFDDALWPDTLNHDKGGPEQRGGPVSDAVRSCGVPSPIANKRPFGRKLSFLDQVFTPGRLGPLTLSNFLRRAVPCQTSGILLITKA